MSVRVSMVPWFLLSVRKKNFLMVLNIKNVSIKSCHIFKKNKNGHFIFGFFWIRSVQNGSNLQIWWTDISNSWIQAWRAWFLFLITQNIWETIEIGWTNQFRQFINQGTQLRIFVCFYFTSEWALFLYWIILYLQ